MMMEPGEADIHRHRIATCVSKAIHDQLVDPTRDTADVTHARLEPLAARSAADRTG